MNSPLSTVVGGTALLRWKSILAGLTTLSGGLGLMNVLPNTYLGVFVVILSSLNSYTIVYEQGLQSKSTVEKRESAP